jgi:hypothetical protein
MYHVPPYLLAKLVLVKQLWNIQKISGKIL